MAELKEKRREYLIPDNFIEEGRIFQGRIRIRYLIEGVILSLGAAIAGLMIITSAPELDTEYKIMIMCVLCAPTMILGITGFNGDPISVTIKSAWEWNKNKNTMLYNPNPKLLKRDPVLSVINKERAVDSFMDNIEKRRQENLEKKININIREGEDYVFAEDEYVDVYTKRLKPEQIKNAKNKKLQPTEKEYLINAPEKKEPIRISFDDEKKPLDIRFDDDTDDSEFFSDSNAVDYGAALGTRDGMKVKVPPKELKIEFNDEGDEDW